MMIFQTPFSVQIRTLTAERDQALSSLSSLPGELQQKHDQALVIERQNASAEKDRLRMQLMAEKNRYSTRMRYMIESTRISQLIFASFCAEQFNGCAYCATSTANHAGGSSTRKSNRCTRATNR